MKLVSSMPYLLQIRAGYLSMLHCAHQCHVHKAHNSSTLIILRYLLATLNLQAAVGGAKPASLGGWQSPHSCQQVAYNRARAESQHGSAEVGQGQGPFL